MPVLIGTSTPGERNLFPDVPGSRVACQVSEQTDGYGKHDGIDSNGRIDFADVVWLFNHL